MTVHSIGTLGKRQSEMLRKMQLRGGRWTTSLGSDGYGVVNSSTTYRVLHSLKARGLVGQIKAPDGGYVLTVKGKNLAAILLDVDRDNATEKAPCWSWRPQDDGRCGTCGWPYMYHHSNVRQIDGYKGRHLS